MTGAAPSLPCPTCGRAVLLAAESRPESFPFCCSRCRLRDLGAWADGKHVIQGAPIEFDPYAPDIDHP